MPLPPLGCLVATNADYLEALVWVALSQDDANAINVDDVSFYGWMSGAIH